MIGCAIACRLSKTNARVIVIERHHDVAEETSKSNTGVADSGWECTPGTLEATLVTRSSPRWEEISDTLDVPFRRSGALTVARNEQEVGRLPEIEQAAAANGVRTTRLDAAKARERAPYVSDQVLGAVEVPDEGIVDSIRLTIAYAELAATNGVKFLFDAPLVDCRKIGPLVDEVVTPAARIRTRYVVNAAGLGADHVSRLVGAEEFRVWPRRGEYLILDREFGAEITTPITQLPNEHTRGVMVVPTTHGSVLLGPTAEDDDDKADRSTHERVLTRVLDQARTLIKDVRADGVIKSFAGLRPASDRTYRIEQSQAVPNVIQACGIRSTGVSGSPAIGEYVHDLLVDAGLKTQPRRGAAHALPKRLCLAKDLDCRALAAEPLGRTVICACEKVTALEIHHALRGPVPARSIAGIAKRTRASWGRCQGAACLSGISFIASMYLPGPAWRIPVGDSAATLGVRESARA